MSKKKSVEKIVSAEQFQRAADTVYAKVLPALETVCRITEEDFTQAVVLRRLEQEALNNPGKAVSEEELNKIIEEFHFEVCGQAFILMLWFRRGMEITWEPDGGMSFRMAQKDGQPDDEALFKALQAANMALPDHLKEKLRNA